MFHLIDTLNKILSKIINGENVSQYEILPFLYLEKTELRVKVNLLLAMAYFSSDVKHNITRARDFIQRAWHLSGYNEEYLSLFEKIHSKLTDTNAIKEAYKRIFLKYVNNGKIEKAGYYFDLWQNAYAIHNHLDKYEYDQDIITAMTGLAEFNILPEVQKSVSSGKRKKKLAYFVTGFIEINSILLKIDLLFAKYHNQAEYDISFYTLNTKEQVINSPQGKSFLDLLKGLGINVFYPEDDTNRINKIISLAKKIYDYQPDLIIFDVAIRNFDNYYLSLILSKIKILCFNQGSPSQFVPPHVNWNIAWTIHPLIDSPVDGSIVPLEFELFNAEDIATGEKKDFNIPSDAFVIVCAGRPQKFQNLNYWEALGNILNIRQDVYLIVIGCTKDNLPDISKVIDNDTRKHFRFVGWEKNYLEILKLADLVIDTYPNGGGVVLVDAMTLGIPILFFTF